MDRRQRLQTQACRRQAVMEEGRKSKTVLSATALWVVLRCLLGRHKPDLDALNKPCWGRKIIARG